MKRATYDDLLALPEHEVGEIIDGDLHASPRPRMRPARAATRLASWLSPPFDDGIGGPLPFSTLAPDWVCEILSPSTERLDRGRKLRVCAREGVGHVWLLSVEARTLEVFRLQAGQWLLTAVHDGVTRVGVEPFDAAELDLARLWGEPG